MFANNAAAFDPNDLQKLKDTGNCVKCDLSAAFLRSINLKGANLEFGNLWDARLEGSNLEGANLKGAVLVDAGMYGTILCNTIMPDGSIDNSGC